RGLVPPSLPGAVAAWPNHNIAAARQLLRGAGYCGAKPLVLNLTYRSNVPTDRLFALTWQESLRQELGDCLQLSLTGMESTTAYRQLGDGAFQLIMLDWIGDYPDADNYLMPLLACSKAKGSSCLVGASASSGSFWAAPGLQQQLQQTEKLQGPARIAVLESIQRRSGAAVPYLPVQPSLENPSFDGSGRLRLDRLSRRPGP
ncbi:MAG: ABC transporter substrate-binding protein, partial [Synechococcaceae bacterium WB9_2_170]|nr:ABC transporter substrate-binding protein [Synechococcaceae bacterium WB9_2_170]